MQLGPQQQQALHRFGELPAPSAPPDSAGSAGVDVSPAPLGAPLVAEQAPTAASARLRRCLRTMLCIYAMAVLVINLLFWTIFLTTQSRDSYPWPMWITFGSVFTLAAAMVNIIPCLPSLRPDSARMCSGWLQLVFGNLALANASVWTLYGMTGGGYKWPMWVTVPSCFAALLIFGAPVAWRYCR
eukprot:TRINITY_DN78713_c0_g1_i1.p2 TRINITY_DN78713_c0_g1~~TRINITY_DN78713_c0_g1_i1.p2  ORF type:complete len:193 (-),score=22.97 TRINITY_DN78713_c0_g1_i1:51-605(-)